ncbi:DUF6262 family protein [Mycobacterium talmoniae]|uniref:Transposase n=1 Tax=Mycobacterium talmoniae TaxID=1858794 RepID=A0A1S1MZD4_9MYCO|nr:DUF6262 family protein [Mycobacterium talmoniae]OHU92456.1 hypothetical protein BKN37_24835 [Mycobacterium talmoniae]
MSTTDDRTEHLRAAAARKSEDAQSRARRALVALENRGIPINFNTVALEAKVSKGFLYANDDLRRQITERRRQPAPRIEPSPHASHSDETSATVKLAVAAQIHRQLRAENEQLRNENAALRGDLLALQREKRITHHATTTRPAEGS